MMECLYACLSQPTSTPKHSIKFPSVAFPRHIFHVSSQMAGFSKKNIEHKLCVLIFCTSFGVNKFIMLGLIQRGIIIIIISSSSSSSSSSSIYVM